MIKEPNFILSTTLGNLYVFSNNLSRLLSIFTMLQRPRRKEKYGVIEDSNKKPSDPIHPAMCSVYSFFSKVLRVYSSFENNPKIFARKEIYAPKLFIVRVRTVLLWGQVVIAF